MEEQRSSIRPIALQVCLTSPLNRSETNRKRPGKLIRERCCEGGIGDYTEVFGSFNLPGDICKHGESSPPQNISIKRGTISLTADWRVWVLERVASGIGFECGMKRHCNKWYENVGPTEGSNLYKLSSELIRGELCPVNVHNICTLLFQKLKERRCCWLENNCWTTTGDFWQATAAIRT